MRSQSDLISRHNFQALSVMIMICNKWVVRCNEIQSVINHYYYVNSYSKYLEELRNMCVTSNKCHEMFNNIIKKSIVN